MSGSVPVCPQCRGMLHKVRNEGGSLNDDQFASVKAGDWYCTSCPSNDRGKTGFCYWWDREVMSGRLEIKAGDWFVRNDRFIVGPAEPVEDHAGWFRLSNERYAPGGFAVDRPVGYNLSAKLPTPLPCPCCGGDPAGGENYYGDQSLWCTECSLAMDVDAENPGLAVQKWNARVWMGPEDRREERLDALLTVMMSDGTPWLQVVALLERIKANLEERLSFARAEANACGECRQPSPPPKEYGVSGPW